MELRRILTLGSSGEPGIALPTPSELGGDAKALGGWLTSMTTAILLISGLLILVGGLRSEYPRHFA